MSVKITALSEQTETTATEEEKVENVNEVLESAKTIVKEIGNVDEILEKYYQNISDENIDLVADKSLGIIKEITNVDLENVDMNDIKNVVSEIVKDPEIVKKTINMISNSESGEDIMEKIQETVETVKTEIVEETKETFVVTDEDITNVVNEEIKAHKEKSQSNQEQKEQVKEATGILTKFKDYISSKEFDQDCEEISKTKGVPKDIIKNGTIKAVLGSIGKTLNMVVVYTGDIIVCAVNFLSQVIYKLTKLATDVLSKLVNTLTLNCAL